MSARLAMVDGAWSLGPGARLSRRLFSSRVGLRCGGTVAAVAGTGIAGADTAAVEAGVTELAADGGGISSGRLSGCFVGRVVDEGVDAWQDG